MHSKWLYIAVLFVITISCKEKHKEIKIKIPVLISDLAVYQKNEKIINTKQAVVSVYCPYYVGKNTDTVQLDYFLSAFPPPPPPIDKKREIVHEKRKLPYFFKDEFEDREFYKRYKPSDSIIIFVDTTQEISNTYSTSFRNELDYSPLSYPVVIKNISSDTSIIGNDEYIPLILEAKDEDDKWCSIEKPYINYGGRCTANIYLILAPNEIAITSCIIYDGNFETELRLKLGNNYSNIFKGKINEGQFIKESINQ